MREKKQKCRTIVQISKWRKFKQKGQESEWNILPALDQKKRSTFERSAPYFRPLFFSWNTLNRRFRRNFFGESSEFHEKNKLLSSHWCVFFGYIIKVYYTIHNRIERRKHLIQKSLLLCEIYAVYIRHLPIQIVWSV